MTTLSQVYGNYDQFWLFCDIDGCGERWRLAIQWEKEEIKFPHNDFDDDWQNYADYPAEPILTPPLPK